MPDVRVAVHLPYLLRLPDGNYATPATGGRVHLREVEMPSAAGGPGERRTEASIAFTPPPMDAEAIRQL